MPTPGWYRDPERVAPVRWWDGEAWTAWQADSPRAPYPPPGAVERVAAKPPTLARRVLLGASGVAAVAVGLTAYGMTLDAREREAALLAAKPSALGSPGASAQEELDLVLDPDNRVVRWSRLFSAELPGRPFELLPVNTSSPWFSSYCSAIHAGEQGWTSKVSWWPSSVTVGIPSAELVDPSSLATTAGALLGVLRDRVGTPTGEQERITTQPVTDVAGRRAARATVVAHYTEAGVVNTPRLRLTIVQIHPLAHLAWLEILQNRATPDTEAALGRAYESIWVA